MVEAACYHGNVAFSYFEATVERGKQPLNFTSDACGTKEKTKILACLLKIHLQLWRKNCLGDCVRGSTAVSPHSYKHTSPLGVD